MSFLMSLKFTVYFQCTDLRVISQNKEKPAKEKHPEMPQKVLIGRVWITSEAINIWEEGCNEQADPLG